MSDTAKRDAVCQEFGAWYRGEIPEEVHWKSAEAMADEIVRLRAIESAVRRMVAAQERMGQGSWFPSAKDIEECDAAWDDLRTALDAAREEE